MTTTEAVPYHHVFIIALWGAVSGFLICDGFGVSGPATVGICMALFMIFGELEIIAASLNVMANKALS